MVETGYRGIASVLDGTLAIGQVVVEFLKVGCARSFPVAKSESIND